MTQLHHTTEIPDANRRDYRQDKPSEIDPQAPLMGKSIALV
jgi:hypothetical protein